METFGQKKTKNQIENFGLMRKEGQKTTTARGCLG